ncbi:MAG: response regulator transcription factor [Myxococcota bacterium]
MGSLFPAPTMINVLLIEDVDETAQFILRGLREAGDRGTRCGTVRDGLAEASQHSFDVIVFDRLLPDMDGLDGVRILRQSGDKTPVLMLTALSEIDDRVRGLNAGADDYLAKPFAFSELYARLQALARRQPLQERSVTLTVGDLVLERTTQTVTRAGKALDLLPREYRILEYLMQNQGRVVTRTMLLEKIWGYSFDPKTSLVQTHVSRLSAKVDRPFDSELIMTVRGSGYVISAFR